MEMIYRELLDLDRILIQFWESRSICLKVMPETTLRKEIKRGVGRWIGRLSPEITRGMVDLAEYGGVQ